MISVYTTDSLVQIDVSADTQRLMQPAISFSVTSADRPFVPYTRLTQTKFIYDEVSLPLFYRWYQRCGVAVFC